MPKSPSNSVDPDTSKQDISGPVLIAINFK